MRSKQAESSKGGRPLSFGSCGGSSYTELRADDDRMRVQRRRYLRVSGGGEMGEPLEVLLAADVRAPGVGRRAVVRHLASFVAPSVLENAQLLISELVTNSVRHSGAPAGEPLIARIRLEQTACRLEVEDRGRDGVIGPAHDRRRLKTAHQPTTRAAATRRRQPMKGSQ
jgi:anti-sigma regulatory factor (Ser/Thr protein kinase)